MTRPRRDPRALRAACQVQGVAARPRIVRDGRIDAVAVGRSEASRVVVLDDPAFWVLAVVEAADGGLDRWGRQILGAARLLAGKEGGVAAFVLGGGDAQVSAAAEAGADRVVSINADGSPEDRLPLFAMQVDAFDPRHIVFAESAVSGDLARRLAAHTRWAIQTAVEALSPRQAIYPVAAGRRERLAPPGRVITVPLDRTAPYAGVPREGRVLPEATWPSDAREMPAARIVLGPVQRAAADAIPLDQAQFVVSAGQGVTDFEAFHAVARRLGATEGASRVVCDAGLMPRAAQVGASGTVLDARCYLALGIAGAPQHLQGLGKVEHVVAVNTDLHAAMVARAGLSIIADAQAVMPALIELLGTQGDR